MKMEKERSAKKPFLIFGRKRMVDRLLDGAPPGSAASCIDNGWINGPTFLEWLRHFVDIVRPTSEKKALLVLDNHEAHKYLEVLEFASKHHVIFVSLAPHTTHRMQPLDTCVYGPLKTYFEQTVSVFQKTYIGRIISQYEVARLFGEAYLKAASTQNAVKGFASTGIWPTNRNIFDDNDYMPSSLTDKPDPVLVASNTGLNVIESETSVNFHRLFEIPAIDCKSTGLVYNVSPAILDHLDKTLLSTAEPILQFIDRSLTPDKLNNKKTIITESEVVSAIHVSPIAIRPLPKTEPPKTIRKRKTQRAEILTSTPIKDQQRERQTKKKDCKAKVDTVKRDLKEFKPSTSMKRQKRMVKKHKIGPNHNKNVAIECRCLVCSELYNDPPSEDWIRCDDCGLWAHEACTSYSGIGSYYCDLCHEI